MLARGRDKRGGAGGTRFARVAANVAIVTKLWRGARWWTGEMEVFLWTVLGWRRQRFMRLMCGKTKKSKILSEEMPTNEAVGRMVEVVGENEEARARIIWRRSYMESHKAAMNLSVRSSFFLLFFLLKTMFAISMQLCSMAQYRL